MNTKRSSIMVTGAFGNLGQRVLSELKARGYRVVAMDLDSPANRKGAQSAAESYDEVRWSDIRQVAWHQVLEGIHAVIHLAAVLPPVTDKAPDLAKAINLDATLSLIDALERSHESAQLVFPSSVTVFGYPTGPALKRVEDEPRPSDNYTRYKIAVEQRLAGSPIPWCVLRVGVSVSGEGKLPATEKDMTRRLFATSPDNPVEYVHPADVALAIVNTIETSAALRRIWLIGGGPSCRVTQHDLLSAPLAALGVDLPRAMLGDGQFYTHWMDTAESERVLRFQRHSFDDFRQELRESIGRWRPLVRPFASLVRWGLRHSLRRR